MSNFYTKMLSQFVGGTVESTSLDNTDPHDTYFGLVIRLPDKTAKIIWFLKDDEGNGPGSFIVQEIDD